jgi:hypothetical protein
VLTPSTASTIALAVFVAIPIATPTLLGTGIHHHDEGDDED